MKTVGLFIAAIALIFIAYVVVVHYNRSALISDGENAVTSVLQNESGELRLACLELWESGVVTNYQVLNNRDAIPEVINNMNPYKIEIKENKNLIIWLSPRPMPVCLLYSPYANYNYGHLLNSNLWLLRNKEIDRFINEHDAAK